MSPEQIRRHDPSYTDHSGERMTERLFVDGSRDPIPLADVLAALVDADGISGVFVHSASFSWVRHSSGDEHQRYLDLQENRRQRTEKWERETWERLKEKYGD
jgi:hypothetical protein